MKPPPSYNELEKERDKYKVALAQTLHERDTLVSALIMMCRPWWKCTGQDFRWRATIRRRYR